MEGDLQTACDALDRALASARAVVDPERLDPIAELARRIRARLDLLGDTVVVALAGGTGSGKSSVLNAVAGEEIAETGPIRPTTGRPLALIPAKPEPGLMRLLDRLGIERRERSAALDHIALVDLPDTDSVVVDHRHTVAALLPQIDAVVWVVDPEKYQDQRLHADYLRPLSGHGGQFTFALNQVDRLDSPEEVAADLLTSLLRDGISDPLIVPVAADPDLGPPIGIELLIEGLEQRMAAKRAVAGKLAADLRSAFRRLADLVGKSGFRYDTTWGGARRAVVDELLEVWRPTVEKEARAAMAGAGGTFSPNVALDTSSSAVLAALDQVVEDASGFIGGEAGRRLRRQLDRPALEAAVGMGRSQLDLPPRPRWLLRRRLLTLAIVLAAMIGLWGVDRVRASAGLLGPGLALLGLVAAWRFLTWLIDRRTDMAARRLADHYLKRVSTLAQDQLDRRVGGPLREALAERAGAAAAITELGLAVAEVERTLTA